MNSVSHSKSINPFDGLAPEKKPGDSKVSVLGSNLFLKQTVTSHLIFNVVPALKAFKTVLPDEVLSSYDSPLRFFWIRKFPEEVKRSVTCCTQSTSLILLGK